MNSFNRTLVAGSLAAAVATSSVGCAAGRAVSLLSKLGSAGKVATAGKAVKAAQLGAGKAAQLGQASKVVSAARGARVAGDFPQTPLKGLYFVNSVDNYVPDELADLYVVAAEDEASFAHIFKRLPTYSELKAAESNVKTVTSAKGAVRVPGTEGGVDRFTAYLDMSPSKNIIVVGHNQGGNFHFANGESLPLSKMARMINERQKRGIFLSCRAKRHLPEGHPATTADLTHDEALRIADDLLLRLRAERLRVSNPTDDLAASGEDAQLLAEHNATAGLADVGDRRAYQLLQETINSAERRATVSRTVNRVFKGGAGGGFTYYVVKLTAKGKSRKNNRRKSAAKPIQWNLSPPSAPNQIR